jgi:serine/threonine protein kinase
MSEFLLTPPPQASPDPMLGTTIGGAYRITRLLGVGGMGHVYEAEHVRLPKRFAIKIVRAELARDEASFERFKREAEIASSLGNRHIVQVTDFNVLPDGSPYMVMEFLVGEDLATRLGRDGRMTSKVAVPLLGQVVSALEAAHARGIVHRDIKPENIFLAHVDDEAEFVKLLDFGLSKMRGSQKRLTANLSVLGTPWYMSPEQARGDADLDHRTDVYALGVVLYQALTGRVPFEGDNVYAVLTQIATQPPPPLRQFAPEISDKLEQVVLGALAKEPDARPASVRALWDAVQWAAEVTVFRASDPAVWAPPPLAQMPAPVPRRGPTPTQLAVGQLPTLALARGAAELSAPRPQAPTPIRLTDAHLAPSDDDELLDPKRGGFKVIATVAGVTFALGGLVLCSWLVARPHPASVPSPVPAATITSSPPAAPQPSAPPPPVVAAPVADAKPVVVAPAAPQVVEPKVVESPVRPGPHHAKSVRRGLGKGHAHEIYDGTDI